MRALPPAVLLALSLAAAGCDAGGGDGTYEGVVAFGFEQAGFTPCGDDEEWWVGGPAGGELSGRYFELQQQGATAVYARVRGAVTGRGEYGHLGAYDRELRVEEVLEVRAGECPRPPNG